ncbi:MAG: gliding motility-associated C-terminal domain-containing protein [Taibaiella sp.]|nr:gliding motility-associated C-terminal domain-containing protein [Taibaiella sp.]
MSTGFNNVTHTTIHDSTPDDDWKVIGLSAPLTPVGTIPYAAFVQQPWNYATPLPVTQSGTEWISYDTASMWIGPFDPTGGKNDYQYIFELCDNDTITIKGAALCDNMLNFIKVDGVDIGFSIPATTSSWTSPSPFTYTTSLAAGTHTIEVEVQNIGTGAPTNPLGADISGTIRGTKMSIIDRDNFPAYVCNSTVIPDTLRIEASAAGCNTYTFNAIINHPTKITSYNWNYGDGSTDTGNPVTHTYTTGKYTITVVTTDTAGKHDTAIYTVNIQNHTPVHAYGDTTICKGQSAVLHATGAATYSWTPASGLDNVTSPDPIATPDNTTTYLVTGRDSSGCNSTDSVRVTLKDCTAFLDVPKAFSPNGDGSNDILYVRGVNISSIHFVVYNRWGNTVFETNNMNQGWDGTYNGQKQPMETYAYFIKATTIAGIGIKKKGNVILLR